MSIFANALGKRLGLASAAAMMGLAAIGVAAPAEAAITYTFEQTGAQDLGNSTFTFTTASYITTDRFVTPTSCSITGSSYTNPVCDDMEFDASPFSANGADSDFIAFNFSHDSGGGGAFYFFAGGAFGANGTYLTGAEFNPPGYGSASQASLIVSGMADVSAVPEIGTWAMMLAGFGSVGAALRRRREATKTSFA